MLIVLIRSWNYYYYFCFFVYNAGVTTLPARAALEPQCAIDMQRTTLNYGNTIHGTSELSFFVLNPDDSTLDGDVTTALHGSGSWLALPSTDDEPMRLVIRRPLNAIRRQFDLISVKLSVLYARRVVIEVFNDQNEIMARRTVR